MRHRHPLVELGKRDLLHQFRHESPTGANSPAPVSREIFADPERSDFKTSIVVRAVGLGFIFVAVRVTARVRGEGESRLRGPSGVTSLRRLLPAPRASLSLL